MKIMKDLPVPPTLKNKRMDYGWSEMEIGQALCIEQHEFPEGLNSDQMRTRAYNSARAYGDRHGLKFRAQVTEEGDVLVWLVERK